MAKFKELIHEKEWEDWISSRPKIIQELAKIIKPNHLYRIKNSGHRSYLYSYSEDGTVSMIVDGTFNFIPFDRRVFGVKPEDLEECELPKPGEKLGTVLQDFDYRCVSAHGC